MQHTTPRRGALRRIASAAAAAVLAVAATSIGIQTSQAAASHAQIEGTGSSWAANAVNQWIADVYSQGLRVVFTGSGSAPGRSDFANRITDFAVSDIGYQGHDPLTGADDTNCLPGQKCRAFAYEPIVAGGTSFPYQIKVAGKPYKNLRLSGQTLAKIFTYQIKNWNDPAITADNNGVKLPSLPITPVTHSEGSGSTAQFTTYLAHQYPSIWASLVGRPVFTEYWPTPKNGQHGIQQSGSDGVMNFVSSAAANGAIGYDEYSYPLQKGWPVAKIENSAGYFTLPDQYNVAVALTHAKINPNKNDPNYLLQDLSNVYTAPEKPAYALSSYSYFLIPTASDDTRMTTAKRQTLADYLYYAVCQGQKEMGPIGYSPLPINLVQASFDQTALLKQADPGVDLTRRDVTTCQNPTFVAGHPEVNRLAQIAPNPPACDHAGQGPCDGGAIPSVSNGGGTGGGGNGSSGPGSSGAGSSGTGGTHAGPTAGAGAASGSTGGTHVDPLTGQTFGDAPANGSSGGDASPAATELAGSTKNLDNVLAPLAVIELIAVLALPPLLYFYILRRRKKPS